MKYLVSLLLICGLSFQASAQSEERKQELTEKLQKELKTLSETVAELSRLMAKDLDESLEDDSVQVHIERSKKALRESAAKIKRYSEELSEDYELSDEQKELLNIL